ncbi:MAG: GyrI-like domain-containing protein [bacterium]|nr:GyrI-like domain-containing protein [bacterium]
MLLDLADSEGCRIMSGFPDAHTYAVTIHVGDYAEISDSFAKLFKWIVESGYVSDGPPGDIYWDDPATVPVRELITVCYQPVRRA